MSTIHTIEQRPLTPWRTKSGVIVGGAYRKPLPPLSADAEAIQAALLGPVDTEHPVDRLLRRWGLLAIVVVLVMVAVGAL